jgi:signal transduction histidine kinase
MDFDMMYLRQILHHLLSNAMKFTESGTVVLSFEVLSDKDLYVHDVVRWTVRDTGIGIAPEFREKLFAPFHQHDAGQTRLYGGLGLGLAITKYLVDAMNGRVWCESELGKGATFIVELPKSA